MPDQPQRYAGWPSTASAHSVCIATSMFIAQHSLLLWVATAETEPDTSGCVELCVYDANDHLVASSGEIVVQDHGLDLRAPLTIPDDLIGAWLTAEVRAHVFYSSDKAGIYCQTWALIGVPEPAPPVPSPTP